MLHQKLKFVVGRHLVIFSGEEDILVSYPSSMPYVEATEESLEMAFQSFEVVSNTFVESLPMRPRMFDVAIMVARVMVGHGYEPRMGLGKNNDGMASLVDIKENRGKFGLGYNKPTRIDMRRRVLRKEEQRHGLTTKATGERSPFLSHQQELHKCGLEM